MFEYVTTLDREVELFWSKSFSGASVLFFLNRYTALATFLYDLTIFIPMSDWVSHSTLSDVPATNCRCPEVRLEFNAQGIAMVLTTGSWCSCSVTAKAMFATFILNFLFPAGS